MQVTVKLARNTVEDKGKLSAQLKQSIKEEFPEVFNEELDLLSGLEAEIKLKEGTTPKFCKSRPHYVRFQVELLPGTTATLMYY